MGESGYFIFKVETPRSVDKLCAECADILLDDPNVEAEVVGKRKVSEKHYNKECHSCDRMEESSVASIPRNYEARGRPGVIE